VGPDCTLKVGPDSALIDKHNVSTRVGQRVFGTALGYEDLIDHDQLRHEPVLAVLADKLESGRASCARWPAGAPRTGASTRLWANPAATTAFRP